MAGPPRFPGRAGAERRPTLRDPADGARPASRRHEAGDDGGGRRARGPGLVRRTPDPEDGRAKVVRLTARGRTFAAECRRAVAAVEARTRRALGGPALRGASGGARAAPGDGRRGRGLLRPRGQARSGGTGRSARNRSRGTSGDSPAARSAEHLADQRRELEAVAAAGRRDHERARRDRSRSPRPGCPCRGRSPSAAAGAVIESRAPTQSTTRFSRTASGSNDLESGSTNGPERWAPALISPGSERVGHDVRGLGRRLVPVDHGREVARRPSSSGTWTARGSDERERGARSSEEGARPRRRPRRSRPVRGSSRRRSSDLHAVVSRRDRRGGGLLAELRPCFAARRASARTASWERRIAPSGWYTKLDPAGNRSIGHRSATSASEGRSNAFAGRPRGPAPTPRWRRRRRARRRRASAPCRPRPRARATARASPRHPHVDGVVVGETEVAGRPRRAPAGVTDREPLQQDHRAAARAERPARPPSRSARHPRSRRRSAPSRAGAYRVLETTRMPGETRSVTEPTEAASPPTTTEPERETWRDRWPPMSYWARWTLTIAAVSAVLAALWSVLNIVVLVLMAAVLAIGLDPAVRSMERRGQSRGRAVTLIFVGLLAVVLLFASLVIPRLVTQVGELADDIPGAVDDISTRDDAIGRYVRENDVAEKLQKFVKDLPGEDHELLRHDRRRGREGGERHLQHRDGRDPDDLLHALAPSDTARLRRSGSRPDTAIAPRT